MKIKNWQLMVLAIVIFLLDFLTLGNLQVINNPITSKIAPVIALICLLAFLFGAVRATCDFFVNRRGHREEERLMRKQEEERGVRATGVEIFLRRLLAILLAISVIPLIVLLPIFGLILGIPPILLALYLWLNRRYHPVFDGLLAVLGGVAYYKNNFSLYEYIRLSVCPGLISMREILFPGLVLGLIIDFSFSSCLFLFSGSVIARLKFGHKKFLNILCLVVICLTLVFLPYLYVPKVAFGESTGGGTGGGFGPLQHFSAWNTQFHMSYDQATSSYIFTAQMPNQDNSNSSSITSICVDGNLVPIAKENRVLQVDNGLIADGKIVVAPGQTAVIKLISSEPFFVVSLFEGVFHYLNSFLK